jgi:hypothetical protein
VDDPLGVEGVLEGLDEELSREFEAARAREELAMEPAAHFLRPSQTDSSGRGHRTR